MSSERLVPRSSFLVRSVRFPPCPAFPSSSRPLARSTPCAPRSPMVPTPSISGPNASMRGTKARNSRSMNSGSPAVSRMARGARVYLTLNTLLKPGELVDALLLLGEAIDRGVDAAIVQDIGLVRLIQRIYSGFEIHGSTQMTVHDASGRACHARRSAFHASCWHARTPLEDIRAIRAAVPDLGLETFIHGALCISYSGQCFMSGMISERSANRGSCAQSCRKDYVLDRCPHRRDARPRLPDLGQGPCRRRAPRRARRAGRRLPQDRGAQEEAGVRGDGDPQRIATSFDRIERGERRRADGGRDASRSSRSILAGSPAACSVVARAATTSRAINPTIADVSIGVVVGSTSAVSCSST